MGEGEGSKDVTDEIENEDQLEGLRNDREENEEEDEMHPESLLADSLQADSEARRS